MEIDIETGQVKTVPPDILEVYQLKTLINNPCSSCILYMKLNGYSIIKRSIFAYSEDFSCNIIALIHLSALRELILKNSLQVFTFKYEPIFDIKYREDWLDLNRHKFRTKIKLGDVLARFDGAISKISKKEVTKLASLPSEFLDSQIIRLRDDYISIGYAIK